MKKELPVTAIQLRAWRKAKGWNRPKAAEKLGISWRTLEMWERGRKPDPLLWKFIQKMVDRPTE